MRRLLLLLFLVFSYGLFAQTSNIRFDQISIEQGLSQSTPNAILQDYKGFMWIGTQDGLNMYDGYKFRVFYNDPDDTTSISDNFIHSVYEDHDKNLWIGTDNLINLYNHSTRSFTRINFNKQVKANPKSNKVLSLTSFKGALWVGTEGGGLYQLIFTDKNNISNTTIKVNHYVSGVGNKKLNDDNISALLSTKDYLFIGTEYAGIQVFDPKTKEFISFNNATTNPKLKIKGTSVYSLLQTDDGHIWAGTDEGIAIINPATLTVIKEIGIKDGLSSQYILSLIQDKDKTIWIGTESAGLIKYKKDKNKFYYYFNQPNNPHSLVDNKIQILYEDRSGVIWVGTNNGINKFDRIKQNFTHYQHFNNSNISLYDDDIWSLYEDENEVLFIGNDQGIDRFDRKEGVFRHFDVPSKEVTTRSVYHICKYNNRYIFGADAGLYYFDPYTGKSEIFKSKDNTWKQLNNRRIYTMFEDKEHNLWVGSKDGLIIYWKDLQTMSLYTNDPLNSKSLPHNVIRSIFRDKQGNIWLGTNGGGLTTVTISKGKSEKEPPQLSFTNYQKNPDNKKSINNNVVLTINETNDDVLWLGTFGGGLNCFNKKTKEFEHYTEKNGLCNNVVYGIVKENNNFIWLSTNKGISRFDVTNKIFQNYYEQDGLQSNEFNTGAYAKGRNGEIMFGGIKGFNVFTPSKFKRNLYPTQLSLTGLMLLNKEVVPGPKSLIKTDISQTQELVLGFRENSFQLEFSALHFSNPHNNQYAYILEGLEEEWNYIGNRNIASFTKLEPGEYTFKIKAANSDGVWDQKPLEVKIIITPPYWKTIWFRLVVFFGVAFILWLAYRTRVSLIKEQKRYLEAQIKERTQKIWQQKEEIENKNEMLAIEKEKVEKLLLNILPNEMVEELKNKGKAQARHYRLASVMFTDFKGFTLQSSQMRPQEVVQELDFYFIHFDEIIAKYNIEKIKTIGDAYMAAGGVPIRNKSNPIDLILAGLEIQRFVKEVMEERKPQNRPYFECRIGIHTGEIIAGVVGIKRFAYDIWGDTVNVASRMESSSEVGKVNVSGATYQYAKEFFICTHRGKIDAKNKGEIDMYFIERIRPELSVNGEGIIPNDAFNDRLEHVLYSKINYKKAEHHIIKLLEDGLPPGLFYHGLHHTLDVCQRAEEIALAEGIDGEDLHILKTAALFHDAGFTQQYTANEPIGCQMAHETLPQFGYSPKQIKMVEDLILATQVPQNPKNHLEQIICDADLDYLGREDFWEISGTLKQELVAFGKINDDLQWDEIQVSFLTKHQYFTKTNIHRRAAKAQYVEAIKERVAKLKKERGIE